MHATITVAQCLRNQQHKNGPAAGRPGHNQVGRIGLPSCWKCERGGLAGNGELNDDDVEQLLVTHQVAHQNQKEAKLDTVEADFEQVSQPWPETRQCRKCGQLKPIDEFYKDSHCAGGYKTDCKPCGNEKRRMWSQRRKAEKTRANPSPQTEQMVGNHERDVQAHHERDSEPQSATAPPTKDVADTALRITVDLTRYPEVYERIKHIAEDEDRTTDNQVRYWLRNLPILNGHKDHKDHKECADAR